MPAAVPGPAAGDISPGRFRSLDTGRGVRYLKPMRLSARFMACALAVAVLPGCGSFRRVMIGGAAEAFSGARTVEVFSSDNDPELVADAMPLALKTYEVLLSEDPRNKGLHLAAASGFVQYAVAFVEEEAERLEDTDLAESRRQRARVALLCRRGVGYGLAGLEIEHPGFTERLREDAREALKWMSPNDVPLLYWAGAGWGKVIASEPSNMARVAEMSLVEAIMRRVLELDEGYGEGDVHEFFIAFEGGRSEAMGGSADRAREHYRRALELSAGKKASPHVTLAATVAVREQDLRAFRDLLGDALAVDPEAVKRWRLGNILARRRAERLLGSVPDLFVEYEEGEE